MNTLMKVFSPIADVKPEFLARLIPYLKCMVILPGYVLFRQGDEPDGLYIVESGGLRATYSFADHVQTIEESMVGGTVAGELSGLSSMPRTATVIAERQSIVWKLSAEDLARLEEEQRDIGRVFLKLVLKGKDASTFRSSIKVNGCLLSRHDRLRCAH
jgi:SulP family sulfate permease